MSQQDFISELFTAVGLAPMRRNFIVDYHDGAGQYYHRGCQSLINGNATDMQVVATIRENLAIKNMTLVSVTEIYGNYSIEEFGIMSKDPNKLIKTRFKILYYDKEKAIE